MINANQWLRISLLPTIFFRKCCLLLAVCFTRPQLKRAKSKWQEAKNQG